MTAIAKTFSVLNRIETYQSQMPATMAKIAAVLIDDPKAPLTLSITELAETFSMTLTGMKKHVSVLEQAGLVTSEKVGRVRVCRLGTSRLEQEAEWIERYRQIWDARFDQLDKVVEELKRKEKNNER